MLTQEDLKLLEEKGITTDMLDRQIARFKSGFPYLKVKSAATVGDGIRRLTDTETEYYTELWNSRLAEGCKVVKFVPASGAASRMFKNLFEFVSSGRQEPETDFEKKFFDGIKKFAFYDALNGACVKKHGKDIESLMSACRYVDVVKCLITSDGLDYGNLPKGLLLFHKCGNAIHTPVEEHLEEGAQYASDKNGTVNIHFTVSPEHRGEFKKLIDSRLAGVEKEWGVKYDISMSEQKSSTDTIAVTMDNVPYRENGKLLFRPAGHGALIENLNDIDADVVFIKNIDNVVPRSLRDVTVKYKKVIGGVLIEVQKKIAEYASMLESGKYTMDDVREVIAFMHNVLCTRYDETKKLEDSELVLYLLKKLHRPIRVCGVVRNDGEPGGGPYIAYNSDGTSSPQIMESAQFDKNNPESAALIKNGSHFNPVDLVCYVKDVDGTHFDLKKYVDPDTGLISEKSKSGVAIKALELPGLWNGSMSDWNTVFVEVPIETFNPVKTVNDLLRPQHQG